MLKAKATAALEKAKAPKVVYTVDAAEIYQITKEPIDKFTVGSLIQVYDSESGIEFAARVVGKEKPDIKGNPGDAKLTIANFDTRKISSVVNSIQRKQRVSEVYSQGATNIDSNDYQDNCDATHPAVIEFYIPEECVRVNKCLLSYKTEKFRAYETSLESDLGTTQTSTEDETAQIWDLFGGYSPGEVTSLVQGHSHGICPHKHTHSHNVSIPPHSHNINYGIYEFDKLPDAIIIKVDGNTVMGQTTLTGNDIDIIPYLAKDGSGKITRGFHKVEIFPGTTEANPNGLACIIGTVVKQIFYRAVVKAIAKLIQQLRSLIFDVAFYSDKL